MSTRKQPSRIDARRAVSPAFNFGYTMRKTLIGFEEIAAGSAAADAEHQIEMAAAEREYVRRQAASAIEAPAQSRNERCFAHDLDKIAAKPDEVNDQNDP